MKIVIPTNNDKGVSADIADHFGRCKTYTFLDKEGRVIEIIPNTSEHGGGSGLSPELMQKHGANVLLCKGVGFRAIGLCRELEIDVYIHPSAGKVENVFNAWKKGELKKATIENSC